MRMEKLLKSVYWCLCGVKRTAVLAGQSLIRNPCALERDPPDKGAQPDAHRHDFIRGHTRAKSGASPQTHATIGGWGEKMSKAPLFPALTLSTSSCYPIYHRPAGHRKRERNKDRENKIICTLTPLNPGSSRVPELMDLAS